MPLVHFHQFARCLLAVLYFDCLFLYLTWYSVSFQGTYNPNIWYSAYLFTTLATSVLSALYLIFLFISFIRALRKPTLPLEESSRLIN